MNETSYLENLARRIEAAARLQNPTAKLFAIADDIRKYKEQKYDGVLNNPFDLVDPEE